jgi:hypothetical protein
LKRTTTSGEWRRNMAKRSEFAATLSEASAQVVRDCGIDAMDALNDIVVTLEGTGELNHGVKRAVAEGMTAILEILVNPVLKQHPALDIPEDRWGQIAIDRAAVRCGRASPSE